MSLNGSFKDSYCVLRPEVKLARTTVRSLMDEDLVWLELFRFVQTCYK